MAAAALALCALRSDDPAAPPRATAQVRFRAHLPVVARHEPPRSSQSRPPGGLLVGRAHRHTATLLDDGTVLIVGGTAEVERWDPRTERSTLVAPLPAERSRPVAVRLADGRVLVAGGEGERVDVDVPSPLDSASLYDPRSGAWRAAPAMHVARIDATAVLLADGRVLVVGGDLSREPGRPESTEIYDPTLDRWTRAGDKRLASYDTALALLPDGRALAVNDPGTGTLSAEVFDPRTDTWRVTAAPATTGRRGAFAALEGGDVLIIVGLTAERFDAAAERWRAAAAPPYAMWSATATRLADGHVLVVGSGTPSGRFALYDPNDDRWSARGYTEHVHFGHTATRLPDGRVLVAGGQYDRHDGAVVELYDPRSRTWAASSAAPQGRSHHTATALQTGEVVLVGGRRGLGGFTPRPIVVALPAGRSTELEPMSAERYGHQSTLLADGRLLVSGGYAPDGVPLDRADLFDPSRRTWIAVGALTRPRVFHSAIRLPDDSVLVVGGDVVGRQTGEPATAERFDPASGRWRSIAGAPHGLWGHALAALLDGTVLVVDAEASRAFRFDPATDAWRALPRMPLRRNGLSLTVLADGEVLAAGGCCDPSAIDVRSSPEALLFDPATERWRPTGSMHVGRSGHSAHRLPSGEVIVASGCCSESSFVSAEVFDPTTERWRRTGDLHRRRDYAGVAQLPDGTVVVAGGCCDPTTDQPFESLEWFDAAADAWRWTDVAPSEPRP